MEWVASADNTHGGPVTLADAVEATPIADAPDHSAQIEYYSRCACGAIADEHDFRMNWAICLDAKARDATISHYQIEEARAA